VVGHVDALVVIDLAKSRDQLRLTTLVVELAAHEILAMAQCVHHIHRDHDVVELVRGVRRSRDLGHGLLTS
jgi:hypothetical protein